MLLSLILNSRFIHLRFCNDFSDYLIDQEYLHHVLLLTSKKSSKSEKVMLYYAQQYHYLEIRKVFSHSYFTSSDDKNVLKTFQSYFYILMPNSILIINMYEIAKNDELMCLKLSININGKHCLKMDVGFLFSSLECFTFRRNR